MSDTGDARRPAPPGRVRGLLLACHPVPTLGVTAVSTLLAAGVDLAVGRVVVLAAAVLTGQLSIGWSNDRIDVERDAATGRADKPAAAGRVPLSLVGLAAGAALVATVVLSFALDPAAALALLILVAAGWAYNLGLKATVWSGLAYAVGFGALPTAPYLARPGHHLPLWWVPAAGALFGLAAHFANVLPDLRDDAATGVRGLPHRLGLRVSTIVIGVMLASATVVLAFGPSRPLPIALGGSVAGVGAAAAVALLALRSPDSPAPFRLTILLALLNVGLIVVLV